MVTVTFAPDADDAWASIIEGDPPLATAVDARLDSIESGAEPGRMRGAWRFCTVRVHGRNDLYAIVWERKEDEARITCIGRSPAR